MRACHRGTALCLAAGIGTAQASRPFDTADRVSTPPAAQAAQQAPLRKPDVIYVPTPQEVVDAMLKLARVRPGDLVYDLGCGDGRLVVRAAELGARGVGVDIDPQRVKEAKANARRSGVAGRVTILNEDLFTTDIRPATVVMLFLLPDLNLKLRPKLLKELKPGTRVVSHLFDMGDWKSDQTIMAADGPVYLWTIPAGAAQRP